MNDFDEQSRRNWERRRSRRLDDEAEEVPPATYRFGPYDEDEDYQPYNPRWRQTRASRARERGIGGAMLSSPQAFALWLQRGNYWWFVGVGVILLALLIFLLAQGRSEARMDNNPFASEENGNPNEGGIFSSGEPESGGPEGAEPAVAPPIEAQPTVTPMPSEDTTAGSSFFVVTGTGAEGLFLRADPVDGQVVSTLPEGTRVEQVGEDFIGTNYVWRQIRTVDGREGWVAVDWLQPAP